MTRTGAATTWDRAWRGPAPARRGGHLAQAQERFEQIDWHWEHRGRIVLGRDLGERLQIAQLQRDGALAHDLGGFRQALRGLEFPLRCDYLRTPFAFGLGLRRDRALHVLRQVDILELDQHHLDAPRLGLRVDHFLNFRVELLALAQQIVELGLAANRSQRRLRKLHRAVQVVAHLGHRPRRIDHAKVKHRADFDRDVVTRDYVLRRNVECHRAQVDSHGALQNRDDEDYSRAAKRVQAAEPEDHRALIFVEHLEAAQQHDRGDYDYDSDSAHHRDSSVHTPPSAPSAVNADRPGSRSQRARLRRGDCRRFFGQHRHFQAAHRHHPRPRAGRDRLIADGPPDFAVDE